MKKLFALAIALVMVFALSVSVFAANSGSTTMSDPDGSWWVQTAFAELTGEDIAAHIADGDTTVTISSPDGGLFLIAYNNDAGVWGYPTEADLGGAVGTGTYTLELSEIREGEDFFVILRNGSGSYTIEWAFSGAAAEPEPEPAVDVEPEPEAPAAEPEAPAAEPAPAPAPAPSAPATGLALAVVPAVMALAAVAVSKKH